MMSRNTPAWAGNTSTSSVVIITVTTVDRVYRFAFPALNFQKSNVLVPAFHLVCCFITHWSSVNAFWPGEMIGYGYMYCTWLCFGDKRVLAVLRYNPWDMQQFLGFPSVRTLMDGESCIVVGKVFSLVYLPDIRSYAIHLPLIRLACSRLQG